MSTRVLFITRKWPPAVGGMETYAQRLAESLAALSVLEVMQLPGKDDGRPPALAAIAAFVLRSGLRLFGKKTDVVHMGDIVLWPLALVTRWVAAAPCIAITAYGLDMVYGRRKGVLPWFYARYLALGIRLVGHVVRIVAISEHTAELCRAAGLRNVSVVTLGVDVPATLPTPRDRPTPSPPYVLFVGRLVTRKGAGWFAREVLPLLPPEIKFVVVGKCWDEDELGALRASARVEYHDFVSAEALLTLRREALVVIMPNIPSSGMDVEGFGLTALEAAADGGVLLASGIEGIVDAVVNEQTGFLLPALDAGGWAAKIVEVRSWSPDRRHAFVANAREVVANRFSWRVVASRTMAAYRVGQ